MNIDKYLGNTTQTMNGVVYKNEDAFNSHIGICYIGEYGLEELEEYRDRGEDLTDKEIVAKGIGSTYDSIIEECEERWEELNDAQGDNYEDFDLNHCAELVFDEADWTYISTIIDQLTY